EVRAWRQRRGGGGPPRHAAGGPGCRGGRSQADAQMEVERVLNMVLIWPPRAPMAVMQTRAIRASSRPYSASEAPSSSSRKHLWTAMTNRDITFAPCKRVKVGGRRPQTARTHTAA